MPRKTSEEITDSERYNKKLPDRLRDLFRKTNATQDQLAEKLGVKRQSISYYCDGSSKPDWERLRIIAEFFGVSSDYLIGITDDPKPKSSVIDDLGLPISVCDMLLEHNKAESLQRRGLEALCETGAFFDLCEKIGILCEAANPLEEKKCPVDRERLLIVLEHCRNKKCSSCPNEKNMDCAKILLDSALCYIGYLEEKMGVSG